MKSPTTTDPALNGRGPGVVSNTDHAVLAARRRLAKASAASVRLVLAALVTALVLAVAEHPDLAFMRAQLEAVAAVVGIFTGLQIWWLTTATLDAEQLLNSIPPTRQDNSDVVDVSTLLTQPKENQ